MSAVNLILFTLFLGTVYFYIKVWCVSRLIQRDISSKNKEEGERIKKESKAAKTSSLVLLNCVVCYTLKLIFQIWYLFESPTWAIYSELVSGMIAMTKSTWNPIIYYFRLKAVRKSMQQSIRSICQNGVQPSHAKPRQSLST